MSNEVAHPSRHSGTRHPDMVLLLLLLVLALAGCQRASQQADQATDIQVTLSVDPAEPMVGLAQMTVTLQGADGSAIEGATVRLKGDMSHVGMVPVEAEAQGRGNGVYQANFEWTMGGDWFVTVSAELPDGRTVSRQFDFSVTGAMDRQ